MIVTKAKTSVAHNKVKLCKDSNTIYIASKQFNKEMKNNSTNDWEGVVKMA